MHLQHRVRIGVPRRGEAVGGGALSLRCGTAPRKSRWGVVGPQPGPCASLLVREGRSVEVAEQMGQSAEECLRTYAHVFGAYDPSDRAGRDALIRRARGEVFGTEASGEAVGG